MKRLKLRWRRGSRQCFGPEFKQVGCIGGLPSHTLGSDMKTSISGSFLLMLAAVVPLAAQTPPPATPPHRAAATAGAPTHRSAGGCVTPAPKISEKIPALPASAPCVKTLYTVTRMATSKLDYASPMVSEEARESLGSGPATFSLNYVDTQVGTGRSGEAGQVVERPLHRLFGYGWDEVRFVARPSGRSANLIPLRTAPGNSRVGHGIRGNEDGRQAALVRSL
jgi:hypothetical protein